MLILVSASLLIWLGLILARGGFWRADQTLGRPAALEVWPTLAVIIPARNEAETIGRAVSSHMASTYPGRLELIVVDDASSDATAEHAREAARNGARKLHVVEAPALEAGWSGKLAALNAGVRAADSQIPEADYVLFTDADIVHAPDLAERLVATAVQERRALVSVMAELEARGLWGGLLMPAFVFFFQKLYPFPRVNDPDDPMAGAAGGVILLRRDVLEDVGGLASIRGALIDDCTLAQRVKSARSRPGVRLVLSRNAEAVSLRDNRSLGAIRKMIARTAYTQLDHSLWKLAGTVAGMTLIYLVPPAAVLGWPWHESGATAAIGVLAWLLMAATYAPTLALYNKPAPAGLALPVAAAMYTVFTIDSAIQHARGQGGAWKGRTYP